MSARRSTHVVVLTPPGRGAIATLCVEGPLATEAVDKLFVPAKGSGIGARPCGRIAYGRWGGPAGEEIVVCRTAPERVEIHCHGGRAAAQAIVESLAEAGIETTTWQAWHRLNHSDPITAEAAIALAAATTERTALILLDQYHGALRRETNAARTAVSRGDALQALDIVDRLCEFAAVGRHLTQPWSVVLAGRPNVGKSSLINALVGYSRAIVYELAGTTRDVVTATTAMDGWPVELADTAGLRRDAESIESEGIRRAQERLESADLVLYVCDAREAVFDDERNMIGACNDVILVRNKIDLTAARPASDFSALEIDCVVETSAITGDGVAELIECITQRLVPVSPPRGAAVPFTAAQISSLADIRASLEGRDLSAAQRLFDSPAWRTKEPAGATTASQSWNDAADADA